MCSAKVNHAARMKEILDAGNHYELTQYIKTVFFKFKMRRRFKEMQALIQKAIDDLGAVEQK